MGDLVIAAAASDPPYLAFLLAIVTGGIGAQLLNGFLRRRSGEGPASAAESLSRGAERLAGIAEDLVLPTQRENVRLLDELAVLRGRYAALGEELARATGHIADAHAATEHVQSELRAVLHRHASDLTARDAKLAAAGLIIAERERTIEDLRVAAGMDPGRREEDPPDPPAAGV